ncbi:MAG TPA: LysR substrate-binding domain-containing protein [Solidesulfovibrio magneticus]|nr:LysR substrate-binding domain-containing protein [Solidesulfovibrio magneticus]
MDYNDLFYFTIIVEEQGFSAAERRLGVSKSTLSRRIATLEQQVGVPLLHRNSRRLALTRAGTQFFEHCKSIERDIREAVSSLAALREKPSGHVRVSGRTLIAQYYLSVTLAKFIAAHPQVRVELLATDSDLHPVDAQIDVAVTTRPMDALPQDVVVRRLVEDVYSLVASPAYIERCGQPRTPEELGRFQTIGEGGDAAGRPQVWELSCGDGLGRLARHEPTFLCNDLRARYHAAVHGAGIALLPSGFLRDAFHLGWLRPVLPDWRGPTETVYAIFPSSKGMLPSVRALIDYLGDNLPAVMGLCRTLPGRAA